MKNQDETNYLAESLVRAKGKFNPEIIEIFETGILSGDDIDVICDFESGIGFISNSEGNLIEWENGEISFLADFPLSDDKSELEFKYLLTDLAATKGIDDTFFISLEDYDKMSDDLGYEEEIIS